jgi:hypothetical protein
MERGRQGKPYPTRANRLLTALGYYVGTTLESIWSLRTKGLQASKIDRMIIQ